MGALNMDIKEMKFFELLDYQSSLLRQIVWLLKLKNKTEETIAKEITLESEVDDIYAEIRRRMLSD
jgi:hypothetical protein